MDNPHLGSSFESFLDEEGVLEDCTAVVNNRVLARQIERAMQERGLTESAMAMRASRLKLYRTFDPANLSVTLDSLQRGGSVARKLRSELTWVCRLEHEWALRRLVNVSGRWYR